MKGLWLFFLFCTSVYANPVPRFYERPSGTKIRYYSNSPVVLSVDRLVVVIHGTLRNADEYFTDTEKALKLSGEASRVLLMAPRLSAHEDSREPGELFWDSSGWKQGDDSAEGVSSFDAVDELIEWVVRSGAYPSLKTVVITGHSAGCQVLARYSFATKLPEQLPGITFRFVISNPSSYLYLSADRPLPPAADCSQFNRYRYGLEAPNRFVSQSSSAEILRRAQEREILLLIGEEDTDTELLDMGCEANSQGLNRRERAENFFRYLSGPWKGVQSSLVLVPNVGHDHDRIYSSTPGLNALFR